LDKYFLGRLVIDRASAVICPDLTVNKYLVSRFGREDGNIIPYGISLPPLPEPAEVEALRKTWSLQGAKVILSIGHLHAIRNRLELVRAFAELAPLHPEARLVIVGSRGYSPTEELVRHLGLESRVVFTGPQPHSVAIVFHAMAYCNAVWLDQNNMASAGVGCLEAMYYGKAVITACPEDTHEPGGLRSGQNILILPRPVIKDDVFCALRDLLDNPDKCQRMGEQASIFAKSYFSWDNVVERHLALYKQHLQKFGQ
jgi:glycosyltransferase involved in cell wall biosynthesis